MENWKSYFTFFPPLSAGTADGKDEDLMKKARWHRLLAAALSVFMLLSVLPISAFAAGTEDSLAGNTDIVAADETENSAEMPAEESAEEPVEGPAEQLDEPASEESAEASMEASAETSENAPAEAAVQDEPAGQPPASAEAAPADEDDLPKAGVLSGGVTSGQPLAAGTGGSTYFRIPALITLQNGWLVAAADARYGTSGDGGGLDTMISISKDGGATWEYSLPIYFPDSNGYAGTSATTVIDPVMIQGSDGTIYLMADVNPTGVTTMGGYNYPKAGTGYITVDGVERLALTSDYNSTNTAPSETDLTVYGYYVGDPDENGYAPVIDRTTGQPSGYAVDNCFNLFKVEEDGSFSALTQTQVNSSTVIQQNVFYKGSALHVYNTGYMWLATSSDNGVTWNHTILNAQIKRDNETALLVSPGRGTLLRDGTIIIPFYTWDYSASGTIQQSTIIFSKDNGKTWKRSGDVPIGNGWSSECELVELADGTLRLFVRNGTGTVCYTDAVWSSDTQNYVWNSGIISTGVTSTSSCNVSAILYSEQIDGQDAILVACPGLGSSRANGRIFVFLVDADNSMKLAYTFHVNDNNEGYHYSCLTELADGTIGLLWENNSGSSIVYSAYKITDIASGAAINNERILTVPLYGSLTDVLSDRFVPDALPDSSIVAIDIETVTVTGTLANLGSDYTFSGSAIALDDCLYTFTGNHETGWTVESVSEPGVYLNHGIKAGFPGSATANAIFLDDGTLSGYTLRTTATDGKATRLYFWKTQSAGKTYSFDRQGGTDASGRTDFLLYRPVKEGEEGSAEIPGYIRTTREELVSGESYLIVSCVDEDQYFVLHPSTSTSERYAHVAKVGGVSSVTTTKVTYTGVSEGTVTFTDTVTGFAYTVNVVAGNLVNVPVSLGKTTSIDVSGDEITREGDPAVAAVELWRDSASEFYGETVGSLGSNADYTGDIIPLSDALYTFTANEDGTYVISHTMEDGSAACLNLTSAGYPNKAAASNITLTDNGNGTFRVYSAADNRYLYFWRNGNNYFDRNTTYDATGCPMQLYRPAKDGEADSAEIPGYIKLASLEEIEDGGSYLVVAQVGDKYYALHPSTSTGSKYAHVVKVDPNRTMLRLNITGVSVGTTDVMVGDVIYRITVYGYESPVFEWADDYTSANAVFRRTDGGDTEVLPCEITSETTAPTCVADGKIVYTATVTFNGETYTDTKSAVIPAVGHHTYGEPTFAWDAQNGCTATFACEAGDDAQTVVCEVTSTTTAPTCTASGKTVYTAAAVFDGKTYTDTKTVTLASLGHKYGQPTFTWSADKTACTATVICTVCGEAKAVACTVTGKTTPATETTSGIIVYTATVTINGTIYSTSTSVLLPATGASGSTGTVSPKTGDTSPLLMYTVLACLAFAGCAAATVWFRRRRD